MMIGTRLLNMQCRQLSSSGSGGVWLVAPSPLSNIRVIRSDSNSWLVKCMAEDSLFHHRFWMTNNQEFDVIADREEDMRQFVIERQEALRAYNWECWRRNGRAVLAGYRDLFAKPIVQRITDVVKQ